MWECQYVLQTSHPCVVSGRMELLSSFLLARLSAAAAISFSFPVLMCCFRALLYFVRSAARPCQHMVSMSTAFISLTHRHMYHSHETRQKNDIPIAGTRTTSAKQCIRQYIPTVLTSIPTLVSEKITTHSYAGFSRYANQYFIQHYKYECVSSNCYMF